VVIPKHNSKERMWQKAKGLFQSYKNTISAATAATAAISLALSLTSLHLNKKLSHELNEVKATHQDIHIKTVDDIRTVSQYEINRYIGSIQDTIRDIATRHAELKETLQNINFHLPHNSKPLVSVIFERISDINDKVATISQSLESQIQQQGQKHNHDLDVIQRNIRTLQQQNNDIEDAFKTLTVSKQ